MARATKKPSRKRTNPTRKEFVNDVLGFIPGVGTARVLTKYAPGQADLNRFVSGRNPRGFTEIFHGSGTAANIVKQYLNAHGIAHQDDYHDDVYYVFVPSNKISVAQRVVKKIGLRRNPEDITGSANPSGYVLAMTSQFAVNGKMRTIAAGVPVVITQTSGKRVFVKGDWDGPFSGWIDKAYLQYRRSNPIGASRRRRNPEDIEFLNDLAPEVSYGHIEFTQDGIERFTRGGYVYRAFSNTPVFQDGYRVGTVEDVATPEQIALDETQWDGWGSDAGVSDAYLGMVNPRRGRSRRRNPESESDAVYEGFHGQPPSETLEITESMRVHGHLAGLGDLTAIEIKLSGGTKAGGKATLTAPDPATASDDEIVHVCSNEQRTQLYLVGGNQEVDVVNLGFRESFDLKHDGETFEASEIKDRMILGEIMKLTYRTEKGFDKFETIDYFHKLGEDTRARPFLTYDTMSNQMGIAGGEYHIHDVGIVN